MFIYHNTFVDVGRAWTVSGTPKEGFAVVANLAVAEQKASQPWPPGNARLTADEAADDHRPLPCLELGQLDAQPRRPIPAAVPPAVRSLLQNDADADRDFWGDVRGRFDQAGACQPSLQKRPIEAKPVRCGFFAAKVPRRNPWLAGGGCRRSMISRPPAQSRSSSRSQADSRRSKSA